VGDGYRRCCLLFLPEELLQPPQRASAGGTRARNGAGNVIIARDVSSLLYFPAVVPLCESQIPTCISLCQQAMKRINDKNGLNTARAVIIRSWVVERSKLRPASIVNPRALLSSLLDCAQWGRGLMPAS
jgi:hypothetical protein